MSGTNCALCNARDNPDRLPAANFAQISGTERQKTASTARSGFTPRFGAAITVKENPRAANGVELPEREKSRLYILGGDDYAHSPGSGGYRNDVWYTTGASEWPRRFRCPLLHPLACRHDRGEQRRGHEPLRSCPATRREQIVVDLVV